MADKENIVWSGMLNDKALQILKSYKVNLILNNDNSLSVKIAFPSDIENENAKDTLKQIILLAVTDKYF